MAHGYKAIFELENENSTFLEICSYSFEKDINEKTGSVQSKIRDGIIHLGFISLPPPNIMMWGMKFKLKNGRLRIMQIDENNGSFIPEEELIFEEASCTNLKIRYDRYGKEHFRTFITICANNLKVGKSDNWVRNDWLLFNMK